MKAEQAEAYQKELIRSRNESKALREKVRSLLQLPGDE